MTYNILDEELEGYLQLVKIDIETSKPVKIADTAFNIYYIAEDGRETLVEMNDPKSGNAWAKTSTFYTDSNGEMKTPENCRWAGTASSRSKVHAGISTTASTMLCLS